MAPPKMQKFSKGKIFVFIRACAGHTVGAQHMGTGTNKAEPPVLPVFPTTCSPSWGDVSPGMALPPLTGSAEMSHATKIVHPHLQKITSTGPSMPRAPSL